MPPLIWIDGQYSDKANARVSVFDHGLLYGDGVFEGMRSYGGKVCRLKQHLERLWAAARGVWLKIPIGREGMAEGVTEPLGTNRITDD